jgi:hypothetical protein
MSGRDAPVFLCITIVQVHGAYNTMLRLLLQVVAEVDVEVQAAA